MDVNFRSATKDETERREERASEKRERGKGNFIFPPRSTETVGVIKGWQGFVSGTREVAQVGWLA